MEPILNNHFEPSPYFDWYDWEWCEDEEEEEPLNSQRDIY